ncbi:hypothetical protein [Hydrogenophaga sp.]|uniref:hypothetical protein n=1 Tax=Hydrogenophaga sp. TaxID=1904254 RepID=UPI00272FD80F|nr:hypothetical protein [Hydrogenophaga sp.]MDP2016397.1 hypothetical protein [Hydrogenophaga sp.]MDP3166154.1 hypothetical protein [Hydrogenophaga sp.]MDP3812347.1 hypothetical protein [Hydrogenophaga sp.]
MINISTTSPVSWPTPPSAAVAPVEATPAVKPVQSGGREAQTDVQARREARRPVAKADDEASPATPLLPRPSASDPGSQAAAQARQEAAVQRTEQALKKAEADKAGHKKAMDRLQEVLSNMWAASAAVVDQALGIEPKGDALPGNQSDTAPDLSAVAASTISRRQAARLADAAPTPQGGEPAVPQGMPWPVMPSAAEEGAALAAPEVPGGEVIAYDEHGNSSLAPLEAGSIISERV